MTLNEEVASKLSALFPSRFEMARQATEKGGVRKYVFRPSNRVVWTVLGRRSEYEILPTVSFCSCDDFFFNVLQGKVFLCYHLLAQRLAVALDGVEELEKPDDAYEPLMAQWRRPPPGRLRPSYLEVVEDVREVAFEALNETQGLSSRELHMRLVTSGFEIPSSRNLAMALSSDPKGRFRHTGKLWFALQPSSDKKQT